METALAIENAARHIGMDYDNVLYSIRRCADRNEAMHSMVSVYTKNYDFNPLALQLSRDISWPGTALCAAKSIE